MKRGAGKACSDEGRVMGMRLAVLVAASFLPFLAVPDVAAQGGPLGPELTLGFEVSPEPIRPGAELKTVTAVAMIRCDVLLAAAGPSQSVVLTLDVQTSEHVVVIGALSSEVPAAGCAAGTTHVQHRHELALALRPNAPGLQPLEVAGTARVGDAQSEPSTFAIVGTYIPLVQINVANGKLRTCNGPCRIEYQFEVTNFGNARTIVSFELTDRPSDSSWAATSPEPLTIDTEQSGLGYKQTIAFVVEVPGGANSDLGAFTLTVHLAAAADPEQTGTPFTTNVLARNVSLVTKVTPAPMPLALGLAVLGAALLARRRA